MEKDILKNCSVIIRSTGERTEGLCRYSIEENGINPKQIDVIKNISPFSKALKEGYELALSKGKKYTFFVDADMILFPHALAAMAVDMDRFPNKSFFMNPLVYDYLSGLIVSNGPHLYRTELLSIALKHVPKNIHIRPETYVVKKMESFGYFYLYQDKITAMHEFEQWNKDIFSRSIHKYRKMSNRRKYLKQRFSKLKDDNQDFEIAMEAFLYAESINNIQMELSKDEYISKYKLLGIKEKKEISYVKKYYNSLLKNIPKIQDQYEYSGYANQLKRIQMSKSRSILSLFKKEN